MSNTQKIWLWIFIAMFVLPEILWGNLIRILKISFLPIYRDVQYFNDTPIVAFLIIIIETIGISGIFYLFNKKDIRINISLKFFLNVLLAIIFLALIVSLYLSYAMSQISLF